MTPRFQGANLDANLALVEQLRSISAEIGATPAQVAIAWVAAQGQEIVPLVGARTRSRLTEALGAATVTLMPAHLAALAKAFPPDVHNGLCYPVVNFTDGNSYALAAADSLFETHSPNFEFTAPGDTTVNTSITNSHSDLYMISVKQGAVFECSRDAVNVSFMQCGVEVARDFMPVFIDIPTPTALSACAKMDSTATSTKVAGAASTACKVRRLWTRERDVSCARSASSLA